MNNPEVYGVAGIILFFGVLEALGGLYGKKSIRTKDDWLVEMLSFIQLVGIIKPLIFLGVAWLFSRILPEQTGRFFGSLDLDYVTGCVALG